MTDIKKRIDDIHHELAVACLKQWFDTNNYLQFKYTLLILKERKDVIHSAWTWYVSDDLSNLLYTTEKAAMYGLLAQLTMGDTAILEDTNVGNYITNTQAYIDAHDLLTEAIKIDVSDIKEGDDGDIQYFPIKFRGDEITLEVWG